MPTPSQIQTFTQKSDFFQTTFDLKVWIQTFAENSDQSGRPGITDLYRMLAMERISESVKGHFIS